MIPWDSIVSLVFAGAFFVMGLYAISHRWRGIYVAGILAASFVLALIGQPWVQTRVLPALMTSMKGHKETPAALQQTAVELQKQLSSQHDEIATQQTQLVGAQGRLADFLGQVSAQQATINSQQVIITGHATDLAAQQERVGASQRALVDAQLELEAQRRKLTDIESLIKNLYKRKRVDTFRRSEANQVQLVQRGESSVAVFRLKEPAVSGSVDGYFGNSAMKPSSLTSIKNVVVATFAAKTDNLPQEYSFTYTVNPNDSLFAGEVTITSNQVTVGSETIAAP